MAAVQPIGQHAECECLDFGERVRLRRAVSETAGQFHDLGNPTAIGFALKFDFQVHGWKLVHLSEAVESKTAVQPSGQPASSCPGGAEHG